MAPRSQRVPIATCALAILTSSCGSEARGPTEAALPPVADGALRPLAAFDAFGDPEARSAALFTEMNRVLSHPRCSNCHPSDASPRQGDRAELHDPPVFRGPKDEGVAAMECTSCHQDHNLELQRVPGAPKWHLAPQSMAWIGKSATQICEQIQDPARNGGKTVAQIVEHLAHDDLVAWGWKPGHGRTPAPGTQAELGALARAWMDTGAKCPDDGK